MSRTTQSDHKDVQLRRTAVKRYRASIPASEVARQLHHSRSWVYKWVHYRNQHPWTRFRSASRTSLHHPNQLSAKSERRIVRLRQLLMRHHQPRLRFASVGARTIQKEWCRRYPEPAPSLSTIQRVLKRHHLTIQAPKPSRWAYRPHPLATYPNALHATDIITRWITGGEVFRPSTPSISIAMTPTRPHMPIKPLPLHVTIYSKPGNSSGCPTSPSLTTKARIG